MDKDDKDLNWLFIPIVLASSTCVAVIVYVVMSSIMRMLSWLN